MADDERRAEIEAMARAMYDGAHRRWAIDPKTTRWPGAHKSVSFDALDRGIRGAYLDEAEDSLKALDDARGGDEAANRVSCPTCNGEGRIDFEAGWHGPPGVERHHWHPCPDCDGTGYRSESWRCTDCNCVNREDEAFCFRCGAGQPEFPARVSPSRDGSVAVEIVRRLRYSDGIAPDAAVREIADWIESQYPAARDGSVTVEDVVARLERIKVELRGTTAQGGDAECLIDSALAEFSPASTSAQAPEGDQ